MQSYVYVVIGILLLLWGILYFFQLGLWSAARVSGLRISLLRLFRMRIRKIDSSIIVSSAIEMSKAGLMPDLKKLEELFLEGGDVSNVSHALVMAKIHNIDLSYEFAARRSINGENVFETIKEQINNLS